MNIKAQKSLNSRIGYVKNKIKDRKIADEIFYIDDLKSMNFQYIHSNISTFVKTYNYNVNSYESSTSLDKLSDLKQEFIDKNKEILNKLKKKTEDIEEKSGFNLEVLNKFINKQDNSSNLIKKDFFDTLHTGTISNKYNSKEIKKILEDLIADLKKENEKLKNNSSVENYNFYNSKVDILIEKSNKLHDALDKKTKDNKDKNTISLLINQILQVIGWEKEVQVYNILDKMKKDGKIISANLTGKEKRLDDINISIPNISELIGLNIKSNSNVMQNGSQTIKPKEFWQNFAGANFQNYLMFLEYCYWNTMALNAWHTNNMEGDQNISSMIKIIWDKIKPWTKNIKSIYMLSALPKILLSHEALNGGTLTIENIKEAELLEESDKNIWNYYVILNNKAYHTYDFYDTAIKQYGQMKDTSNITSRSVFNPKSLISLYRRKKEIIKNLNNDNQPISYEKIRNKEIIGMINTLTENNYHFLSGSISKEVVKLKYKINKPY